MELLILGGLRIWYFSVDPHTRWIMALRSVLFSYVILVCFLGRGWGKLFMHMHIRPPSQSTKCAFRNVLYFEAEVVLNSGANC